MALAIRSSAFAHNGPIPVRFTADGAEVSPPLECSGLPPEAQELALIVDDPDAPTSDPWVHWVLYKIPLGAASWPETVAKIESPPVPAGAVQGLNSWSGVGYGAPAPPRGHGVHHYRFRLFALDVSLEVEVGLRKSQLLAAMEGHVCATAELVGTYQR